MTAIGYPLPAVVVLGVAALATSIRLPVRAGARRRPGPRSCCGSWNARHRPTARFTRGAVLHDAACPVVVV